MVETAAPTQVGSDVRAVVVLVGAVVVGGILGFAVLSCSGSATCGGPTRRREPGPRDAIPPAGGDGRRLRDFGVLLWRSAEPVSRRAWWGGIAALAFLAAQYLFAVLSGFRNLG